MDIPSKEYRELLDLERLKKMADILKVISHPIRLSIVQLLEREEKLSVNEICKRLKTEQSLTSHHLSNMKLRGVLVSKREGKQVFYSLKLLEISQVFDCLAGCKII